MRAVLPSPPADSVSCLAYGNGKVCVGSWDKEVRLYDLEKSSLLKTVKLAAIAMCAVYVNDQAYVGCSDGRVYQLAEQGDPRMVIKLGAFPRGLGCLQTSQFIVAASMAAELLVFDPKDGTVICAETLQQRPFAMSVLGNDVLLGTAGRIIVQYQFIPANTSGTNKASFKKTAQFDSPLRHQTRQVLLTPQYKIVSSVEGRVGVEGVEKYAFRAHKTTETMTDNQEEAISHPVHCLAMLKDTLVTAGEDGFVYFWDLRQRKKIYKIQEGYCVSHLVIADNRLVLAKSYCWERRAPGAKGEVIELVVYKTDEFGL